MGLRLLGCCNVVDTDRGGAATAFSTGLVAKGAPCRAVHVRPVHIAALRLVSAPPSGWDVFGPSAALRSGLCTSSRPKARTAHRAILRLVSAPPSAGMVGGGCCAAPRLGWASLARTWRCGMASACWDGWGRRLRSAPCLAGIVCCLGVQLFVDVVFTFDSTHVAMAADKALAGAGVAFTMIPTPTAISAGCGISLRLSYGLLEQARSVLATQTPPIVSAAHGLDEVGAYTPL